MAGGARPGADGAPERIFLDVLDADRNGEPYDFTIDMTAVTVNPFPKLEILDEGLLRRSVARSFWLDTGTDSPRYSFDATFPETGLLRDGEKMDDLVLRAPLPEGASIRAQFDL